MFIIMTGISGRLLVDRLMRKNGLDPHAIGSLERLAIVGVSGMGALTFRPVIAMGGSSGGARPKILTHVDGEDWMIKFPSSDDGGISENRNMIMRSVPGNVVLRWKR